MRREILRSPRNSFVQIRKNGIGFAPLYPTNLYWLTETKNQLFKKGGR